MAALTEPAPQPQIVDLREVRLDQIDPLLEEEIETWERSLDWDFRKSADLVRRFVDLRALNGCGLLDGGALTGYGYYVLEEQKGLIGDIYLRRSTRNPEDESRLLAAILDQMMTSPQIGRIEAQLMMVDGIPAATLPGARFARAFLRNFMVLDLTRGPLPQGRVRYRVYIEKWMEHLQDQAAALIASAYTGHIDSNINDQYRSAPGARRFLYNIVQYPGCGTFFRSGSLVAFDVDGHLCGLCLASLVAQDVGHITQICVAPWVRGTGVGYELLRLSLAALREDGCRKVSLTVTASNHDAIRLYERVGFFTRRQFSAYVWEGF